MSPIDEYRIKLFKNPKALDYLEKRRVSIGSIRKWGLGYEGAGSRLDGRIVFPIRDQYGRLVGFQGRAVDPETKPKYWFTTYDKSKYLYGLHECGERIVARDLAVLVEGNFDAIAVAACGYGAVAVLGSSVSQTQIDLLARYTDRVVVLPDFDASGSGAAQRNHNALVANGFACHYAFFDDRSKDAAEYYEKHGLVRFRRLLRQWARSVTDS